MQINSVKKPWSIIEALYRTAIVACRRKGTEMLDQPESTSTLWTTGPLSSWGLPSTFLWRLTEETWRAAAKAHAANLAFFQKRSACEREFLKEVASSRSGADGFAALSGFTEATFLDYSERFSDLARSNSSLASELAAGMRGAVKNFKEDLVAKKTAP